MHDYGIPAGVFGDWRTGLTQSWRADIGRELTQAEKLAYRQQIEAMRKQREIESTQRKDNAATRAADTWAAANKATENHAYLLRKGIKPHGARQAGEALLIPMRSDGKLHSLQYIQADGSKRFLAGGRVAGCYFSIGNPEDAKALCIVEGFATGATVHEATGYPVAVAFNAGNLLAVSKAMRERFPEITLIVCADDDYRTEGNPGITKATEAAKAISGKLAIPCFGNGRPEKATDFNDVAAHSGIESVHEAINDAKAPGAQPSAIEATQTADERYKRDVILQCATDIPMVQIQWLWHEWLAAGKLTILAGAAGTGKTTLALLIAAAITNGGAFPDGSRCQQRGNVLVWSSEDAPDDTLIPRLLASGADPKRCHFISGVMDNGERVPFDPATDIHELNKAVLQIGGASLLIVDPIVSAVSGNMNAANEVRRSLQALVDFADSHNCAVLGITHFSKGSQGRSPQERVIGSQAFAALARMVWSAGKSDEGDKRVLVRSKSNIAPDDGGFAYSLKQTVLENGITASHAQWEGVIEGTAREILGDVEHDESAEGGAKEDAERFLRDLLADGPIPAKQIELEAKGACIAWATIRRASKSLGIESVREGTPGKRGAGVWVWRLPKTVKALKNDLDAHTNNVSILTKSEHLNHFGSNSGANEIEVTL